jgi:hypothetical protein
VALLQNYAGINVTQNHENANTCNIGQRESMHTKCKRLNLAGGQAYDRSSDPSTVIIKSTKETIGFLRIVNIILCSRNL